MPEPGPLLARGRECDIYEYGPNLVLRRSREGRSMAAEAEIIGYLAAQDYPVPRVAEVSDDGRDLVMERVDGPSMVAWLSRHPWTVRRHGAVLAELHQHLHSLQPPGFLPTAGAGESIVHLDLHPLNVIVTKRGPVVIDWGSASRGEGVVDVALAWVLMSCGQIPGGRVIASLLGRFRGLLVDSFLQRFDLEPVKAVLGQVVERKAGDPHMSQTELAAMRALVARHAAAS